MKIKQFLLEMIQDIDGCVSSKRIMTFVCCILVVVAFVVDLFTDLAVSDYVFNGVSWIVIAGLGFIGAERFGSGPLSGLIPNLGKEEEKTGE